MYYEEKPNRIALCLGVAAFSFVLGWQATAMGFIGSEKLSYQESKNQLVEDVNLDLFWTVWKELETKHINEDGFDKEKLVYGAIKGMVGALDDPYTVYMDPEESREFSDSLEGTLEGIGAELTIEDGGLIITSPIKNSPAERAGLLPGDLIYKIGEEVTHDMSLYDAITKIRGKKGTTVTMTIVRKNEKPFEVSIVRDSIDLNSVNVEKLDGGIVYLEVNQFNDKTLEEFNIAVSEMVLNPPKGLIVDLRFNGGGYLDIAVDMLSHILPTGSEAVIIEQRGMDDKTQYTIGAPKIADIPLVVLVNEGSASASEIVAGAVQDHKRGVVMGTQSFGKGTVQEVESFSDGSSIRITIARWLTPNKSSIDHVGVTPDILVEMNKQDAEKKIDTQKNAAVEYLKGLK